MSDILRGTWVVAYRELLRFVRERSRLIGSLAMPLTFLVIFGVGFSGAIGQMAPGVDYVQFMYPGIIAMGVLTTSLFAGVSVVYDREYGFLREILVAPLRRTGITMGKSLGAVVVALLQVGLLLLIAPIVGVPLSIEQVVALVPVVAMLAIALSGLGILLATRMRSQQGFQLLIQLLVFPLIFLAGVFFPIQTAPEWLQVLSKLDPLTYGVDAIRQIMLGPEAALGIVVFGLQVRVAQEFAIITGFAVVLLGAAIWAFGKQE